MSEASRCKAQIHRYRRLRSPKGKFQYKCMDCPSYTYNPNDLLGRKARCYYCGNLFTIVPDTLRYVHLKCGTNLEQCRENIADIVEMDMPETGGNKPEDTLRRLIAGALDPEKALESQMTASVRKAIRSGSEQEGGVTESESGLLSNIVKQAHQS